jgi:hypothetical protein
MVLQCINGVGSNPIEGRTKIDSSKLSNQKFDSCKLSNFCSSLDGIYIINSFGYLLKQCLTVNVVKNWIIVVFNKWVRIVVLEKS